MSTREDQEVAKAPPPEDGFEIALHGNEREFIPWQISDKGKDLMIIDRLTGGMPPHEFFSAVEDLHERGRGPLLLAMMGTSIRARYPSWSVDRIVRLLLDISVSEDVEFIDGDEDEETETVPKSSGDEATPELSPKLSALPDVQPGSSSESQASSGETG